MWALSIRVRTPEMAEFYLTTSMNVAWAVELVDKLMLCDNVIEVHLVKELEDHDKR